MSETILVTGGAGFIGSHIAVELATSGYDVVLLDNFGNSTRAVLPRIAELAGRPVPCIEGDVRDIDVLRRAFHDHPVTGVVHCAGLKAVAESEQRPLAYYSVNVGGTFALAEVMGEAGVAKLVFSSSATVYGQPEKLPATEDTPTSPRSVYGRTKCSGRAVPARPRARQPELADRDPALFQSGGRASVGPDRRGAVGAAREPGAAACRGSPRGNSRS